MEEAKNSNTPLTLQDIQKQSAILDLSADSIFIYDEQGNILFVNKTAYESFGFTEQDMLNKNLADNGLPDYVKLIQCRIKEVLEKNLIVFEAKHIFKDGAVMPVEIRVKSMDIEGRKVFCSMIRDITGRKKSEDALSKSEERYRRITEAISDYIYTVRVENGRPVETMHSEVCFAVTGYTSKEFASDPYLWIRMVYEEDHNIVRKQAREVLAKHSPQPIEHRIIRKDGAVRWVESSIVPNYDMNENLISYDGVVRDITERKRAEEAFYASEKKFRDLLETIQLTAVMLDLNGNIIFCNDYLLGVTGWSREEVLNRSWFDLFLPEETRDNARAVFRANIEKGDALHNEYPIMTREGIRRLIVWDIAVLHNPEGDVIGAASIGIDVTDHRKLEEQLRQSQKMEAIGHLAGGAAHDFNNILTAIIGYASILNKRMPAEDPMHAFVERIIASSERAANLTKSLLAYSRKQIMDLKALNLNNFILVMKSTLKKAIPKNVEFRVHATSQDLIVQADKNQIEQALINLAANARDAMPNGGTLTISTEKADIDEEFIQGNRYGELGRYAVILVADTGTGMDQNTKEHMFDPFFTTKEVGKGTGLGLAMVYGTIKQQNGFVHVSSEPGKGTTFRIYLPLTE